MFSENVFHASGDKISRKVSLLPNEDVPGLRLLPRHMARRRALHSSSTASVFVTGWSSHVHLKHGPGRLCLRVGSLDNWNASCPSLRHAHRTPTLRNVTPMKLHPGGKCGSCEILPHVVCPQKATLWLLLSHSFFLTALVPNKKLLCQGHEGFYSIWVVGQPDSRVLNETK